ncbi:5-hydroxytryptamine receptor 3A-like isoform X1 [Channa argus]|uniref:5-hydroxytryptamine receptor 3A-like isoform X1 n=1 Tax=Channa argus TaxID=215402 RepID=UPI0035201763
MMHSGFLFLLLLTGSAQPKCMKDQPMSPMVFKDNPGNNSSLEDEIHITVEKVVADETCTYQALLKDLNLTKNNDLYTLSRPAKSLIQPTLVYLKMVLYAILDVRETDQTFIPYVWIYMGWTNLHICWNPEDYCGLKQIKVPNELMWKPDLSIEEMTEKDKAPPSPYLTINHDGYVEMRNDQVLTSTCRMQVYKFPFDVQKCNLSFKSIVYSYQELQFLTITNESKITNWSLNVMGKQYEWLLISVQAHPKTVNNFEYDQSMVVYTISMKRRPALYIVNFILPVLFLLFLDFASFLIHNGGEKLGFKITVLLAVTVMQLILNEILPASSDRIPLIAVYCTGSFALMLVSLLETILVMHLKGKESAAQDNEEDKDPCLAEDCVVRQGTSNIQSGFKVWYNHLCVSPETGKWTCCKCACEAVETPAQVLPDKEGSSNRLMEGSRALDKFSDDLREMEKTITAIKSSSRKKERKPGYWIALANRINKVFFICYVIAAMMFLIVIFSLWNIAEDK